MFNLTNCSFLFLYALPREENYTLQINWKHENYIGHDAGTKKVIL